MVHRISSCRKRKINPLYCVTVGRVSNLRYLRLSGKDLSSSTSEKRRWSLSILGEGYVADPVWCYGHSAHSKSQISNLIRTKLTLQKSNVRWWTAWPIWNAVQLDVYDGLFTTHRMLTDLRFLWHQRRPWTFDVAQTSHRIRQWSMQKNRQTKLELAAENTGLQK